MRLSRGKKTSRKNPETSATKKEILPVFFTEEYDPLTDQGVHLNFWDGRRWGFRMAEWSLWLWERLSNKKNVGAKWRGTTWWIKTFTVIHVQNSVFVCCIFFVCLWCLRGEEFQEYDMLGVVVSFDHLLKTPKTPGLTACWMSGARRNWWICVPATRVPCQGVSNTHVSYRYD